MSLLLLQCVRVRPLAPAPGSTRNLGNDRSALSVTFLLDHAKGEPIQESAPSRVPAPTCTDANQRSTCLHHECTALSRLKSRTTNAKPTEYVTNMYEVYAQLPFPAVQPRVDSRKHKSRHFRPLCTGFVCACCVRQNNERHSALLFRIGRVLT